jgi:hypothetical protein
MNRSVSLTLTADDYVTANRLHFLKCLRSRGALAAFAMLVVAYLIWMATAHIDQWGAIGVIALNACFAAVVVLMVANYFLLVPISTRSNLSQAQGSPPSLHLFLVGGRADGHEHQR